MLVHFQYSSFFAFFIHQSFDPSQMIVQSTKKWIWKKSIALLCMSLTPIWVTEEIDNPIPLFEARERARNVCARPDMLAHTSPSHARFLCLEKRSRLQGKLVSSHFLRLQLPLDVAIAELLMCVHISIPSDQTSHSKCATLTDENISTTKATWKHWISCWAFGSAAKHFPMLTPLAHIAFVIVFVSLFDDSGCGVVVARGGKRTQPYASSSALRKPTRIDVLARKNWSKLFLIRRSSNVSIERVQSGEKCAIWRAGAEKNFMASSSRSWNQRRNSRRILAQTRDSKPRRIHKKTPPRRTKIRTF